MDINAKLSEELSIKPAQVEAAVKLIDDGNTIPFIARYRKEVTGSLDDEQLRALYDRLNYLRGLEKEMKDDTLQNILFDYYGSQMSFLVFFEKKGVGRMPFDLDLYRSTASQYEKRIKAHSSNTFMKIDMKWAGDIYFNRH